MGGQRGQATVEWVALVLLAGVLFSSGLALAGVVDAPWFARTIRCALLAGCHGEDSELAAAYGEEVAGIVRAYAPGIAYEHGTKTLPVDFRRCRARRCSDAPDRNGLDVWRSSRGAHATVFTHAVDGRGRGGDLFVQYWLFYPDSVWNRTLLDVARRLPGPAGVARKVAGYHDDDWESYQLRITRSGAAFARASAHSGYSGRKRWPNPNELPGWIPVRRDGAWTPSTGWTRVSKDSHAGHIVDGPGGERYTASNGIAIVPIESLSPAALATKFAIKPPWLKGVYLEPGRNDS